MGYAGNLLALSCPHHLVYADQNILLDPLSIAQHLTASAQTAGVRLMLILRGRPFRGD